jgi:hypothetical protein
VLSEDNHLDSGLKTLSSELLPWLPSSETLGFGNHYPLEAAYEDKADQNAVSVCTRYQH